MTKRPAERPLRRIRLLIWTVSLKLGADSRRLYLQMSLPFRPFHPLLFIPWRDIESVGVLELPWVKKKTRVRITFTQTPGIPLDVDWYVAGEIQQRANG